MWFELAASDSPFHTLIVRHDSSMKRARFLRSVMRARERVGVGDWVLAQDTEAETSVIGRVRDIVQAEQQQEQQQSTRAFVRLWLDGVVDPRVGERGELWAVKPNFTKCMMIHYESTHVTAVQRCVHAQHDVYLQ